MQSLRKLKIGAKYRHFKGGEYEILNIATHTETSETLVIYQDVTDKERVWARPLEMFNSPVDKEKYPTVNQKYRFEEIKE